MLEFVDIRPYFRLPAVIVDGACAAGNATSVQLFRKRPGAMWLGLQFDKDAADLFYVVLIADHVFVTQQVTEPQFAGFLLGFGTSVKWSIFGPELFS
jgi:hypothetical protein